MHFQCAIVIFALALLNSIAASSNNSNVWNFQIARKDIAEFQFNGMGLAIWENQGVENTTTTSKRQFFATPLSEFLPNSTKCEYNALTGQNFVSYNIQMWNDRLQLAAMDRLKHMQIDITPEQMQPLPFYQVRVVWNSAQQNLKKAQLSTTWNNNLQQQSIQRFILLTDDKETCQTISATLQNQPEFFTDLIALEYSLSAATTATKTIAVKTEHFLQSQLMASLKSMDVQSAERYMKADDANRLSLEIMDNVMASELIDGDYVPDTDELHLKDVVTKTLQLVNVNTGNFTNKIWDSVYWDPVYARPDKVTSYLNKVLTINQGNHTVSKSASYTNKGDGGFNFGIDGLFSIGGHGGGESTNSATYDETNQWLLEHKYDVEIQGEIFVQKNLTLQRLNLGVLDRQETIYSKSVQLHHVEAPGQLRVTTGTKSNVESEDIKTLRQNVEALTNRLGSLEPRVGSLEPRVGKIEPILANAVTMDGQLDNRLNQVTASLSTLTASVGGKLSRCTICAWSQSVQSNGQPAPACGPSAQKVAVDIGWNHVPAIAFGIDCQ